MEIPRGLGEHNMQILMLTPDGRIMNALGGYVGPRDLVAELEFALGLLKDLKRVPRGSAKEFVSKAHADRADSFESRNGEGLFAALEDLAAGFVAIGRSRAVEDHRFVAKNPLLPVQSFRTAMLVGDAKSAFVWHTSGDPKAISTQFGGRPSNELAPSAKRQGKRKASGSR
jgi:hypothetical protein